jgi:ADP-ribose pyrophosphatase YjhB (NUDIX family)
MTSEKPFTYKEFKNIYSKVPRLSVDVIVIGPKGIALTLRSIDPHRGEWHIPGATVLYRENVVKTAHRVARRELHVSIHAPKLLGYIEYNEEPQRGFGRSLSLVFLAKLKFGKLLPDEDASDAAFFSKLPKNIVANQKKFLTEHLPELL